MKPRSEGTARAALLRAALSLFAQRGFEGASTREIAERAEVQQGLVRHHFGNKEALWREVVSTGLRELGVALAQGADRRPDSPASQSSDFALIWANALLEQCELLQLIVHALLEPGQRRAWLFAELRAHAEINRDATREESALSMMRAVVLCAAPVLAPAWQALRGSALDAALIARVQREAWAWLHAVPRSARAPGPWSLAAALQRRAATPSSRARVARDS